MSTLRVNIIEGLGDPDVVQIPTGVSGQYVQEAFDGTYGVDLKPSDIITKGPWVDARAYGTLGTQAAITAALADIGSDERTLYLAPGTWSITSNLATLANVNLKMERGAILAIATGVTVTINGSLETGLYQIFSCAGTGKVTFAGKISEINAIWWGSDRNAIQAAIDCYDDGAYLPKIKVPAGLWDITTCLDATNKTEVWLSGDAASGWYTQGTVLLANSGTSKAVLDLVGSKFRIENISIDPTGAATPSTIGIICGGSSTNTSIYNQFSNVSINMGSIPTANNGLGTVALINDCAEETTYDRMYLRANLPLLVTTEHALAWISGHTFTITSEYTTMGSTAHNGIHNFHGLGLTALDYHRPCAAIRGLSFNFDGTFLTTAGTAAADGTYIKGILASEVYGFKFNGEMENVNTALDIVGQFQDFNIQCYLSPISGTAELITANTSGEIVFGKCSIMVPEAIRTTNRKYIDATFTSGSAWTGTIIRCDFICNQVSILESALVGEAILNKWNGGSLAWTDHETTYESVWNGKIRKMAFSFHLSAFDANPSTKGVTMITITMPTLEAAGHMAGAISAKMHGHVSTGGGTAAEIGAMAFTSSFSLIRDSVGVMVVSDSDGVEAGAQADLALGTAVSSGGITLTMPQILLSNPLGTGVNVTPYVTGSGANIIGAVAYVSGTIEFYLTGWETRAPLIDLAY